MGFARGKSSREWTAMNVRCETDTSEEATACSERRHEDTRRRRKKERREDTHTMPHASFALSLSSSATDHLLSVFSTVLCDGGGVRVCVRVRVRVLVRCDIDHRLVTDDDGWMVGRDLLLRVESNQAWW